MSGRSWVDKSGTYSVESAFGLLQKHAGGDVSGQLPQNMLEERQMSLGSAAKVADTKDVVYVPPWRM